MGKFVDLTGQEFGRLTVIRRSEHRSPSGRVMWVCRCRCGVSLDVQSNNLRSGNSSSCGCANREAAARWAAELGRRPNRTKPDDEIGYTAAHDRVRRAHGSASRHACVDCARPAKDWSLRHDATVVRVARGGRGDGLLISPDPSDYVARCKKCHAKYDERGHGAAFPEILRRARAS